MVQFAVKAGAQLLSKVGLSKQSLSTAGAWLKDALWGSASSKVGTTMAAGSYLVGGRKRSVAAGSQAAAQIARNNAAG